VAKLAKSGIKTIVNLRGPRDDGVWNLEAAACKKAGINLLDFTARSRAAPSKEMLHKAKSLFKSIEKPVLMHCKSGADRAGLMSALYLLVEQGRPVREAMGQLALKYGHLKMAKTGLIDAFFSSYIEYEDSGVPFYEWVDNIYDPEKITATFKTKGWAVRLNDCFLRRE